MPVNDSFLFRLYMLVNSDKVNWYGFLYVATGSEEGDQRLKKIMRLCLK